MVDHKKYIEFKKKQLKERLEQLYDKLDFLVDEQAFYHPYGRDEDEINQRISETYEEINQIHGEIHLIDKDLVASSEIVDIYLEEGSIEKGYGYFAIFLHGTSTRIGHVRLNSRPDNCYGNIGYGLGEGYRGHRFMLQSLELLKETMLKMKIIKPILTVEPDNMASVRTIQNFGGVLIRENSDYDTYEVDLMKDETAKKK